MFEPFGTDSKLWILLVFVFQKFNCYWYNVHVGKNIRWCVKIGFSCGDTYLPPIYKNYSNFNLLKSEESTNSIFKLANQLGFRTACTKIGIGFVDSIGIASKIRIPIGYFFENERQRGIINTLESTTRKNTF